MKRGVLKIMSLNEAYDVLERYYLVIFDISDSNYEEYDVDVAYTKLMLEQIIDKRGELSAEEVIFLKALLSDDIGESVEEAIQYLLGEEGDWDCNR